MEDYGTPSSDQSGSFTPIMWDRFQELQMATSYSESLQPISAFHSGFQTSKPFLDSYSGYTASGRISGSQTTVQTQRRREQNRASQRAYRERQKKTQHDLEQQISEWERKYRALVESHSTLKEEVSWLKAYIKGYISCTIAQ